MTHCRVALALGLLVAPPCPVGAQVAERDVRVENLDDSSNQGSSINTALGETAFIMLARGARIDTIEMSRPDAYQLSVTAARDGLYLRQRRPGAQGSMTINAGARRYVIALTSDPNRPAPYVVSFRATEAAASPVVPPPSSLPATATTPCSYKLGGDKQLRPLSISDDGAKTYIRWAPDQSIPAVFALEGAGREETINGYMRDGAFTIDRVYPRLIFRIDKAEAFATRTPAKRPS